MNPIVKFLATWAALSAIMFFLAAIFLVLIRTLT